MHVLKSEDVLWDPERLAAVREIRELGVAPRAAFDRLARLAATVLNSPVAQVTLVGETQFTAAIYKADNPLETTTFKATDGEVTDVLKGGGDCEATGNAAADRTLCPFVVAGGKPLLVPDARTDIRFAGHPSCARDGLVAYAGSPIRETGGRVIGSLCVVDRKPRTWSDRDRFLLDAIARSVTTEVVLYQDMDRHRRLLDAFDTAPVAVAVTRGVEHIVEYLNPIYRELLGDCPIGMPGPEAFPDLAQRGFFAILDQVLATGEPHRAYEQCHSPKDSAPKDCAPKDSAPKDCAAGRYFDISCSAIGAATGEPYGVLVVAADVTAQVLARRAVEAHAARQRVAAEVTAAVNRSLDPHTELDALARSVVPTLADVCGVYLLDQPMPPGRRPARPVRTTRVTAVGPVGVTLPPAPQPGLVWPGDDVLTDAIVAGGPVRNTFEPGRAPQWTADVGVTQLWCSAGVHSVVTAPVIADGLVLAVVAFIAFRERPSYTEDDLALLQQIGLRAGVAIGHGVAYQRSREHALALQRSMLTEPPKVPGLEITACYRPAGLDAEVGGDWYDAFLLPDGDLAIVIGDVVGHDMAAAASMGQLRSMLRALAVDSNGTPDDVLARLDRLACELQVTRFTTLLYGRVRRIAAQYLLCWANAGHPAPLLCDRDGRGRLLTGARGLVLGAQPDVERSCLEVPLPPGSTLLLYTDGLTERRGGQPEDDIIEQAAILAELPLEDMCEKLLSGAPPHDDIALLALRVEQ